MLQSLSIRDIVLIERLDLTFHDGLCVLTGETGAGKSILLDALGLALGARGDSGLVRAGADQASVTAVFEPAAGHPVWTAAAGHGLPCDGVLILRRQLGADGRSRAFVNDQPTSVGLLRQLGEALAEVHGHFEQYGLLDPARHRPLLDAFGGLESAAADCARAYAAWRAAQAAVSDAEAAAAQARQDEAFLRHAQEEMAALDPQEDEEPALVDRRATLMNRERLVEAMNAALAELAGERPVEDALRAAARRLERAADKAGGAFDAVIESLDRAAAEAGEALRLLEAAGSAVDAAPGELQTLDDRLFALRDMARKHRVTVADLPRLRHDVAAKLNALDADSDSLARLTKAQAEARQAYVDAAAALSRGRTQAAGRLDKAVAAELPPLKLEKAVFRTRLARLEEERWSAGGTDGVSFEVATNPGTAPGPLHRIASAGELSRFMLALRVVLAGVGSVPTLIFDEVDSGIGGATAAAVGERLARLSEARQVLVVTHSPQVAARAAYHWHVRKTDSDTAALTEVTVLTGEDRQEEVARMLSGARVTDEARAAAASLMGGTAA